MRLRISLARRLIPLLVLVSAVIAACGRDSVTSNSTTSLTPEPSSVAQEESAGTTPLPSNSSDVTQEVTSDVLTLTLSLTENSYHSGENIEALITIRNVSSEDRLIRERLAVNFLSAPDGLRDIAFIISRPTGETRETLRFVPHIRPPRAEDFGTVDAGGTYEATIELGDIYPFKGEGNYTIQALYTNAVDPRDGREAWKGKLLSNVVSFTVVR